MSEKVTNNNTTADISAENISKKEKKYGKGNPYQRHKGSTWYIYYHVYDHKTGKQRMVRKGGFKTKKVAQKYLYDIEYSINNNNYIEPNKTTVEQYLSKWLSSKKAKVRAKTFEGYTLMVEKHLIPGLGTIKLQELSVEQIDDFYAKKQEVGGRADGLDGILSPRTIVSMHRVLRNALGDAVDKDILMKNPAEKASPPKLTKYIAPIFDSETILRLLELVKDTDLECPIALGGLVGLRRGEVLGLKWKNVDLAQKTIYIRDNLLFVNGKIIENGPKTVDSIRTIRLPDVVVNILKKVKERQDTLLNSHKLDTEIFSYVNCYINGDPLNPSIMQKRFSRVLKKYGFKHISFHCLRHSAATLMLRAGVPINIVSRRLGHANIQVTIDTYGHVLDSMDLESVEKINCHLNADIVDYI
jgi:integrase